MPDMEALVQRIEFQAANLQQVQSQISSALTGIGNQSDAVSRKAGGLSGALRSGLGAVGGVAMQVGRDVVNMGASFVAAGGAATAAMVGLGIKTASELETAQLQFETLLGSADAARERVADLFEFAKETPFEAGPILKASRLLQTFGGDALASSDNLRLVGDAAAASSQGIDEIAFWIGRAYSAIQGGQPFGEAAMRLQELAILSPEARSEMEGLQESGADASEVFGVLEGSLGRFSGAMVKMAGTFTGLKSTLSDVLSISSAEAFRPIFDGVKDVMQALVDFSESPAFAAIIGNLNNISTLGGNSLGRVAEWIDELTASLDPAAVDEFFTRITLGVGNAVDMLGSFGPVLAGVSAGFLSMKATAIPILGAFLPAFSPITGAMGALLLSTENGRDALRDFGGALKDAASVGLPPLLKGLSAVADVMGTALASVLDDLGPAFRDVAEVVGPALGGALETLAPKLGEIVEAFGELVSNWLPPLAGLFSSLLGPVAQLVGGGLGVLADLLGVIGDNADALIPILAGLAAAIGGIRLANFISDLGGFAGALSRIQGSATTWVQSLLGVQTAAQNAGGAAASAAGPGGIGALAGVGVGVGVAMAGIGIAIAGAVAVFQHFQREAQASADRTRAYTEVLDELGDSAQAVQDIIAQELTSPVEEHAQDELQGFVDTMKGTELGVEDLNAAIRGSGSDWDEFTERFRAQAIAVKEAQLVQDGYTVGSRAFMQSMGVYNGVLDDQINSWSKVRTSYQDARAAQDLVNEVMATGGDKTRGLTTALSQLRSEYERLAGETRSQEEANIAYEASLDALGATLGENAGQWDASTEGGRANRTALLEAADAAKQKAEADLLMGANAAEVEGWLLGQAEALVQSGISAGMSEEAMRAYLAQMGLTPEQISTTVYAIGLEEAAQRFDDYVTSLELTPAKVETYAQLLADEGIDKAREYLEELGLTPTEVDTFVMLQAAQAQAELNGYLATLGMTPEQRTTLMELQSEGSRAEAADYIATLNLTPEQKETLFNTLGIPKAEGEVKGFGTEADFAARARNANLKATPTGVAAANAEIDDAARDRTVFLNVISNASKERRNILATFGNVNPDGTRARGGPVVKGKTYLVGEEGPELFTAASSGYVIPNNQVIDRLARGAAQEEYSVVGGGRSDSRFVGAASVGGGPAVAIGHAEFRDEVDLDLLFARADSRMATSAA